MSALEIGARGLKTNLEACIVRDLRRLRVSDSDGSLVMLRLEEIVGSG